MTEETLIDAEFVEVKDEPNEAGRGSSRPQGYGRQTTARSTGVLDSAATAARAVAGVARAAGAQDAARKIENAADVAEVAAEVGRQVPSAVAAIDEGTRPLRGAWSRMVAKMKEKGYVGERKPPFEVKNEKRPWRKKKDEKGGP